MTSQLICSDGHPSTSTDFCSECGIEMPGQEPPAVAAASPAAKNEKCPQCGAEREEPSSPFCGVCGYNFNTGQGGDVVPSLPAAEDAPQVPESSADIAPDSAATPEVIVAQGLTGPHIGLEVSFSEPTLSGKFRFVLYGEENLIGRQSSTVKQTVPLDGKHDQAVSARHCVINRSPEGTWTINDVGSTNGTRVNGQDLTAGVEQKLSQGDRIEIGRCTVITVTEISS